MGRAMIDRQPPLDTYISNDDLSGLIERAKREDLGSEGLDLTSLCAIAPDDRRTARFCARQGGRLAGNTMLASICAVYDANISTREVLCDGTLLARGVVVAELSGPLRSLLALERVALNFLTHLSGIATLTAKYVEAVRGSKARIFDTRKTTPGLRSLEKYAVSCGGGSNHRMGLYDALLIKDNHLAHLSLDELPPALRDMVARARTTTPPPAFIEVEVDDLEQFRRVLSCDVDVVLLDNMDIDSLRRAVEIRDRDAPGIELEVSGGVTLENVRPIAETGIDRISVGRLTHSAPAFDLSMDVTRKERK